MEGMRLMDRETFLYNFFNLRWVVVIEIQTKRHKIKLRQLLDMKHDRYGSRVLGYDVVIDGVPGPHANTVENLIKKLESIDNLCWVANVLKKHIRIRRLMC